MDHDLHALPGLRQGAGCKAARNDDWGRISQTPQGGTTAGNEAGGTVWWIRAVFNPLPIHLKYCTMQISPQTMINHTELNYEQDLCQNRLQIEFNVIRINYSDTDGLFFIRLLICTF